MFFQALQAGAVLSLRVAEEEMEAQGLPGSGRGRPDFKESCTRTHAPKLQKCMFLGVRPCSLLQC